MTTRTSSHPRAADHVDPPAAPPGRAPAGSVLVGVDTTQGPRTRQDPATGRPVGALAWAVAEARASGRGLHLLTACAPREPLAPGFGDRAPGYAEPDRHAAGAALAELAAGLPDDLPGATTTQATAETTPGRAAEVLLEVVPGAGLLVVGQRRLGAVRRWVEGSTSATVAGLGPVPVVVVPDDWPPPGARDTTDPVVVGLDLTPDDLREVAEPEGARHLRNRRVERARSTLAWAASYAERHGVALRVVCSWHSPAELEWSAARVVQTEDHRAAEVHRWIDGLPGITVARGLRVEARTGRPSEHLLAAAASSSLTVVGRRARPPGAVGPHLGSTGRVLLRHAPGPVAVVPHPDR